MRRGTITKIIEFVCHVEGLEDPKFYEKIQVNNKQLGFVAQINETNCFCVFCDKLNDVRVGDTVEFFNENFKSEIAYEAMGKLINPLGKSLFEAEAYEGKRKLDIERPVVPIKDRGDVCRPVETGISGIDMVFPIGCGQRQMILGDKQTGKTQICLDTIVNQKGKNQICIYVGIGKTKKEVLDIHSSLKDKGALDYTIMVCALNDTTSAMMYIAPYVASSIAEEYMELGMDSILFFDDLSRHADAYREVTLLMEKMPGREAYPAEIFYIHSRLLERATQHKDGGSITMFPLVETKSGDISDYISTNIISITDGQLMLMKGSFDAGQKPALSYTLSVSRLGGAVQRDEIKKVGNEIRIKVARYLDMKETFAMSNPEDLTPQIRTALNDGANMLEDLVQESFKPRSEQETIEIFKKYIN